MYNKFLWCVVVIISFNSVALSLPISNIFGNFNIAKIETPFNVRFEVKTSLGSPRVIDSLTSGMHRNRFSFISTSRPYDESNIARNVNDFSINRKQNNDVIANENSVKNETVVTNTDTPVPAFNHDNSRTDINTEDDLSSRFNTEFTTDFTTTEDYETTTIEYEDEVLSRSGVSPEIVASLLG